MNKHTPGPWTYAPTGEVMKGYSQSFGVAEHGKPNLIAGCFSDVKGGYEVAEANAKLISAAPDLLEVAKRTLFIFDNEANYPEGTIGYELAQASKAAILKSTT